MAPPGAHGPLWDLVAFDEVAGIHFSDKDGVQIMKAFMASGSFARGRDAIHASASMVFVGNINQPVDTLVKTSHLLAPFPDTMIDSAFFARFHAYIPGWEIPKMRPELFTNQYGLITDYLAELMRAMRKRSFADALDRYFKLGRDRNQRDTIAVRRTVSGLLKLLYPHGEYAKEAVKVACDSGAKRILLPMASVSDIPSIPGELFAKFQTSFYSDPVDAVSNALGWSEWLRHLALVDYLSSSRLQGVITSIDRWYPIQTSRSPK